MKKNTIIAFIALLLALTLGGCASTARMMENATLTTNVVMQDTLFLDKTKAKEKKVFVDVTNTSEVKDIPLDRYLREKFAQKNICVVEDAADATWIVQANISRLTYNKVESMGADLGRYGAIAGGVVGYALPGTVRDSWFASAVGGVVGNIVGAAVGSIVKVEAYEGSIDVQIKEKSGTVKETKVSRISQGSATTVTTETEEVKDYQTYRTSLSVTAKRTNINLEEAVTEIAEKASMQIAALF